MTDSKYEAALINQMNIRLMNNRDLRNGLWISNHQPSEYQLEILRDKYGIKLVGLEEGIELGSIDVSSNSKKKDWIKELERLRSVYHPVAVSGQFPKPVWYYMTHIEEIIILSPLEVIRKVDDVDVVDHLYFVRINSE